MPRLKFIFILFFLHLLSTVNAQVLKIRDVISNQPLEFVTVYSPSLQIHISSNQKGQADISSLAGVDSIVIKLLGYKTENYSFSKLETKKFKIYLQPSELSLQEVVVSATRWDQEKKDIPSKITTIQKRDVILQNPQTAADLLAASGDVFIQKSQLGGGSPMIRGFATNRVLITVDGVRMNNAIFRSGNIQNVISIDPLVVERTEVIFGPGAVMYGSDAIGGAMNFYSLNPRVSTNGNLFTTGSALVRYSTANNEKTGHLDFNLGLKKIVFLSSFSYSDFENLKMGAHGPDRYLRKDYQTIIDGNDTILQNSNPRIQVTSGYHQINLLQKIRFSPNEKWDFQYGIHYSTTSNVPRYDRLLERDKNGIFRDGEWYYGPQIWQMNVLNVVHNNETPFYNKFRFTIAQQFFEESRHNRNFKSSSINHRTETLNAYSVNLEFDKPLKEKHDLLYGAEVVSNGIGSFAERENLNTGLVTPLSTRYPNGSEWNSFGGYLNYLFRANQKISFQSGLRYSHIIADATFDTTFFSLPVPKAKVNSGAVTGSTGIAFRPNSKWQFNLNLSTGFRAPNIDDIAKVFDSEPGAVIVPNPDIKSEYAYNAEVGITRIIKDFVKIELTSFYTHLDNAMVRREFVLNGKDSILYDGQMSRVLAIQNAASAFVYGIQSGLEIKLPYGFGLMSRFTYQVGKEELDEGGSAALRHAVPWFGVTHLTYNRNKLKADVYIQYQSAVKFNEMPPSEIAKKHLYAINEGGNPYSPQWITINFKAVYHVTDFLLLNAGVENLSDLRYRPYSSGISAPGRNFIFSVRTNF